MDAYQLWQATLGQLQLQLERPTFDTWVRDTHALSYEDGVLVVGVHNAFAQGYLEGRMYGDIQRVASTVARRTVTLRFVVQRNGPIDEGETVPGPIWAGQQPAAEAAALGGTDPKDSHLNPRYTFEDFIVGQSNRLAHAGSLAVAEKPGQAYNPLFIYGGAGLGKTHLLHAIGNRAVARGLRTLYVSTETFTNELINAIRLRTTDDFRAKYRTIELLLLDDVQFLISKDATQEEFFHTFNDLYQENRQIVLSSDRPPKAFISLEERLRSRFEWGLIADVKAPDYETRMAILATKAESQGLFVPNEVLAAIASRIESNIRELEGALTRVTAYASMLGEPLTMATVERALGETAMPAPRVSVDDVQRITCEYYGVTRDQLLGRKRSQNIALCRQVAMYLVRDLLGLSYPQIGQAFGGRDHTTALYACDKLTTLYDEDDGMRQQIIEVKNRLSGRPSAATPERIDRPRQLHRLGAASRR
ncbi:MAG: chromosomal replication initiator protein DnaA [Chloroflexi bacterium]|nr:chromosomal replication initiator protein DnaA [Chloroflexota bacterium]